MYDALDLILDAQTLDLLPVFSGRPTVSAPPKVKGHCRFCGKPVARGIYAHEKSCGSSKGARSES